MLIVNWKIWILQSELYLYEASLRQVDDAAYKFMWKI